MRAIMTENLRPPLPLNKDNKNSNSNNLQDETLRSNHDGKCDWPAGMAELLERCWAGDCSERPTFPAVVEALTKVLKMENGVANSSLE